MIPPAPIWKELLISAEQCKTEHPKIFVANEAGLSHFQIARALKSLRRVVEEGDPQRARAELMHWVREDLTVLSDRKATLQLQVDTPT